MARVKKKEHEKLDSATISRVISLLEPSDPSTQPITKKEACSILNISYNTTRLGRIIEEFREREAYVAKRKAANRGKPASAEEVRQTIEEYLSGDNISTIAGRLFRSPGFIKAIIERVGVPQRPTSKEERAGVELIPDSCVSDDFKVGETVWSAKYHRPARIVKQLSDDPKYLGKVFHIYVMEETDASDTFFPYVLHGGFNACQPAFDLAKLSHLEELGINLERI